MNYDSLGRLSSFKYDFVKHSGDSSLMLFQSKNISISTLADSAMLFMFHQQDTVEVYNYYEKSYKYDAYGLQTITVFSPVIYRGYIDGVYMRERVPIKKSVVNLYSENGELIKSENYIDDKLHSTLEYVYKEYSNNNHSARLLTKTILKRNNGVTETWVDYTFK